MLITCLHFGLHLINKNHDCKNIHDHLTPIHYCNKSKYMDTLEEFEIYKYTKIDKDNMLNDKLVFNKNVLYDKLL